MCDIIIYSALKVKSTVSSGSVSLLALFLTCRFTNKHTPPVLHTSTCAPRSRCGPCLWLLQHHAASLKHCLFAYAHVRAAFGSATLCACAICWAHEEKQSHRLFPGTLLSLWASRTGFTSTCHRGMCLLSSPTSANHQGECGHPVPAIALAPYSVCVWDVLYTHQIITEKLWTPSFCIWCMFKTLHISQWLWVPAVRDCVHSGQSLTTCNIHNIYNTNHAENNTLHKVPKHNLWPLCPQIFYVLRKEKTTFFYIFIVFASKLHFFSPLDPSL